MKDGKKCFRVRNKYSQEHVQNVTNPMQTVISAWAAPTVGGIDVGDYRQSVDIYHWHARRDDVTSAV